MIEFLKLNPDANQSLNFQYIIIENDKWFWGSHDITDLKKDLCVRLKFDVNPWYYHYKILKVYKDYQIFEKNVKYDFPEYFI